MPNDSSNSKASDAKGSRSDPSPVDRQWGRFAVVALQLLLLALLIRRFEIVHAAFGSLMLLAVGGFIVHHLLPGRFRLPFFATLSLAGIVMVLGLIDAAWLIAIGLLLIAICHLPIAFALRVVLLLAVAAGLTVARHFVDALPVGQAVWPILGSMFMFRLIMYMYDLYHQATRFSLPHALSYFFLLPNVCFPLFPLVDYKTFAATRYDTDPIAIYQLGIRWMMRGVIHLILYRLVYHDLLIDMYQIHGAGALARYMLGTFLLYLRVSGDFHLIVGLLHLFGFNLPETHHFYVISSGFTDFWRRINIYWKDFILKVFFKPTYFRLKRLGEVPAMVIATLVAFACTWFFHTFQFYWLRDQLPHTAQDAIFWTVLAVLVIINTLHEQRYKRRKQLKQRIVKGWPAVRLALQTIGTFLVICILWSAWTSRSLPTWVEMMSFAGKMSVANALWIVGVLILIGAASVVLSPRHRDRTGAASSRKGLAGTFGFSAGGVVLFCLVVMAAASEPVTDRLSPPARRTIEKLSRNRLNKRDMAERERGYYEDLTDVTRFNRSLWLRYLNNEMHVPHDWRGKEPLTDRDDFLQTEYTPSASVTFKGALLSINRWGMRDRDYEQAKPPGVYRFVALGQSNTVGHGVDDGLNFESLLEQRLNQSHSGEAIRKYEILNMAVPAYSPYQKLWLLETRGFDFEPDAVLFVVHSGEAQYIRGNLYRSVRDGIEIPYPELLDVAAQTGLTAQTAGFVARGRLARHENALLGKLLQRLSTTCAERNVRLFIVFMPKLHHDAVMYKEAQAVKSAVRNSGMVLLDLSNAYQSEQNLRSLQIVPWDVHPNPRAHALLADELYAKLRMHLEDMASDERE